MKCTCNLKTLNDAITIVQKAVSGKTTLPILKGIHLELKNNRLYLIGTDLSIGIETSIEADVIQEGSIIVSSKLFGEIIKKLPDAPIHLEVVDQQLVIQCLKSEFKLSGSDSSDYPLLPEKNGDLLFALDKHVLKNMIRQTIFATSIDETRPILTGSLFEIENGQLSLVSIDGYRLALKTTTVNTPHFYRAVIPSKTLSEVMKILSINEEIEDVQMDCSDKHIFFEINNIKVSSRLLEGEFIKYSQIIPKDHKSVVQVKTIDFLEGIERASLMAREVKNSSIKMTIKDYMMIISSNVEIGSVREEIKIDLEGPELEIGFNPKYLIDALKVIDTDSIILEFSTSVSPCIIKPQEQNNYIYLVLPVRIAN